MKRVSLISILVLAVFALFVTCGDPDGGKGYTYTVTFDNNGGDTEADPQTIKVNSPATTVGELPTAPTREGYIFTDWNTESDGSGTEFTETTEVTADITVYAQWQEVPEGSFVVTFDKNGGDTDAVPTSKIVTPPATTIDELPTAPTRDGYHFHGWDTKADGTGTIFSETTEVTESITVYARWTPVGENNFTITVELIDNVDGDSVSVSPQAAKDEEEITISYTLADDKKNNRLVFSGTEVAIGEVDEAGTGTKTYTVNAEDADTEGTITIIATFTHTDKELDTIAFTDSAPHRTYGTAPFAITVSNSGQGSGDITYSSGHPDIATVNATTGQVTIIKVGECTITATKAADDVYEGTTANYALHIDPLQLTIGAPTGTTTKTYDGTTTATGITAGSLTNKVGNDNVTVTVASATYNSADVASASSITVVYSISGNDAGNYIKPVDSVITDGVSITKAAGQTPSEVLTTAAITHNSITINAVSAPSTGQTVEYAIATTNEAPESGWQNGTTFSGLNGNKNYYVFARAKGNGNYTDGTPISGTFKTAEHPVPPTVVDFENDVVGATTKYTVTGGNGTGTVTIVADPVNNGENSLKLNSTNYNRGAIVPINLPFALENYKSFTFRFYLQSGSSTNPISVYVADATSKFVNYGFGNPASDNNQFANLLLGAVSGYSTTAQWTEYEIDIPDDAYNFDTIKNLQGNIYLAIGINNSNTIDLLFDDLTFNIRDDFVPSSSISPATATFVKDEDSALYKDIEVAMTLYGNTLQSISGGSPAIQSSHYTVSGSTVTLKADYLKLQEDGPLTLTFNFNQGESSIIVITIVDSDEDLVHLVYDFTTWSSTDTAAWRFAPTGSTSGASLITATNQNPNIQVLEVTVQTTHDVLILPFSLEAETNLSQYKLEIRAKAVGGDSTYKDLVIVVAKAGYDFGAGNNNTNNAEIGRGSGNNAGLRGNGVNDWITSSITLNSNNIALSGLTETVEIGIYIPNTNNNTPRPSYWITSVELVKL